MRKIMDHTAPNRSEARSPDGSEPSAGVIAEANVDALRCALDAYKAMGLRLAVNEYGALAEAAKACGWEAWRNSAVSAWATRFLAEHRGTGA